MNFSKTVLTLAALGTIAVGSATPLGTIDTAATRSAEARPDFAAMSTSERQAELNDLQTMDSFSDAALFLETYCPSVSLDSTDGTTSYYKPGITTIEIAESHKHENHIGYVFSHEFAHHLQFHGHYKNESDAWNSGIADKTIEIQADHMAYHLYGDYGYGYYADAPPVGKETTDALDMIAAGMTEGC